MLDHAGIPVTLAVSGDGYSIQTKVNVDENYVNIDGSGFCHLDMGTCEWTFTDQNVDGKKVYTLKKKDGNYLYWNGTANVFETIASLDGITAANTQWQLISADDRNTAFSSKQATDAEPLDITYKYIKNPNTAYFTHIYDNTQPWTKGGDKEWRLDGGVNASNGRNKNVEVWNGNFDNYMALTDLPNGAYEFHVQGLYRDGSKTNAVSRCINSTYTDNVKIYAGSHTTSLQSIGVGRNSGSSLYSDDASETVSSTAYYIPNSQAGASYYYYEDKYPWQTVRAIVTDGTLRFGIKKETTIADDWTNVNRFALSYLGEPSASNPIDLTSYITNPDFTIGTSNGWLNTTDGNHKIQTGRTAPFDGSFLEEWKSGGLADGKMYQTITGLNDGVYCIKLDAFARNIKRQKVYAASNGTTYYAALTGTSDSPATHTVYAIVSGGTLEIGLDNNGSTGNDWIGIDNAHLYYCGTGDDALALVLNHEANNLTVIIGTMVASPLKTALENYRDGKNTASTTSEYNSNISELHSVNEFFYCNTDLTASAKLSTAAQGIADVNYVETTTGSHATFATSIATHATSVANATTTSAITTADDILKAAIKTYVGAAKPASTEAPFDITCLINNPSFSNNNDDGWTCDPTPGFQSYGNCEYFEKNFDINQTLTDMPTGTYKLKVKAFQRPGAAATVISAYVNGAQTGTENVTAEIYVNGGNEGSQLIKNAASAMNTTSKGGSESSAEVNSATYYIPNNMQTAGTYFDAGLYENETQIVATTHSVKFGFRCSDGTGSAYWTIFDDFRLYYVEPIDLSTFATSLTNAVNTAKGLQSSKMSTTAATNLSTAISTYENASYDNEADYTNAIAAVNAVIEATNTSITAYAALKTYLEYIEENVLNTTNFYDATAKATNYDTPKSGYNNGTLTNAQATGYTIVKGSGTNYTCTAALLQLPLWKKDGTAALTDGSGFYVNTWSTENKGTGDAADFANPFYEYYKGSGSLDAATIEGTMTGLTANKAYTVTAKVRVLGSDKVAGSITMQVKGGTAVDVTAGSAIMDGETNTGRYIGTYTATGVTDGDGNLVVKFNVAANSNISWLSFRDVNYAESEAAVTNDYAALNTAITTRQNAVAGFEEGEYAPYNAINGAAALTAAQAIDKTQYSLSSVVSDAITALNTDWPINAAEVNAVYDGDFDLETEKTTSSDTQLMGWPSYGGVRQILKNTETYPGLADASAHTAIFAYNGSYTYGGQAGYNVPLKANSVYEVSFKAAGWTGAANNISVSVLKDGEGLSTTNLGNATGIFAGDNYRAFN